jgi:hypothetical protein
LGVRVQGLHPLQGYLAHEKPPPPQDPAVGLCLGPYDGPGEGCVSYERGTRVAGTRVHPTASERRGNNLKVLRTLIWKARPESGLDCLMCAETVPHLRPSTERLQCSGEFDLTWKRRLNQNLFGDEVYYTASSLIVILQNSCGELHCQKGFDLILFANKIQRLAPTPEHLNPTPSTRHHES